MRIALLFLGIIFLGFLSCNKEKSFEVEAPATGSLRNDATGDCLLKTAGGAFISGTTLSDSNYLEVEVDVATEGAYIIRTDTVNGYSFSGIGNFTNTGINKIRLAGSGTPTAAGQDEFTVLFDTSFCFVPVTVLPAGSNGGPAAFTLQGSGDSCIVAAVAGQYAQGGALNSTNTTSIKVNVTTTGTYNVSTNSMNGFRFSGSGTLGAPGEQVITLIASGTPETEGATVFTVTAGSTTCAFAVNVTGADTTQPPLTSDLFPLTPNSYWTYDRLVFGAPVDTALQRNAGTATFAGETYQAFVSTSSDGNDTILYRKGGNEYFIAGPVDAYTQIELDTPQYAEMIFLKEGLQAGDTWTSGDYVGTEGGRTLAFHYVFTCISADMPLVVNGKTFNNVYAVEQKVEGNIEGIPYEPEGGGVESGTWYYAKGIGLIQFVAGTEAGTPDTEIKIRYWDVK